MAGRYVVQLGSFVWSLGVITLLVRARPLTSPHGTEPLDPTSDPLILAASVLSHAHQLSSARVGVAGITPPEVLAWRVILFSPGADSVFRALATSASLAGRLYALTGLKVTNPVSFDKLAAQLRARGGVVSTVDGCVMATESISDAISEIDRGDWMRSFVADSFAIPVE